MKVFLILLLVGAVGFISWKINKKQRAKYAERKTLHKVSVKPKPTKSNADIALQKEMDRLKIEMDKAKDNPNSLIKYEDESKLKN